MLALIDIRNAFERGLTLAHEVFGEHAFRKWPKGIDRLAPINRALFETWAVELARADRAVVRENCERDQRTWRDKEWHRTRTTLTRSQAPQATFVQFK